MTVDVATLAIRINSLEARNAARDMDRMRDSGGRAERQVSSLETATRKLTETLALIGIGAGIGAIIRMADEYTKFTAQLRLATTSTREYAAALEDVRRIANTSQQDLASTGVLYARIANGTRELGVGQKQVASITEVVNLALKVSGATASESASAMLQLSQAFASGTLRGEEFNAVNEAAPRLMKALADGIGVPVGALKKMAEEGAITSKIMSTVLPHALEQLREEAKQVQTISGAFTVLKNKVMELTAVKAEANGMVRLLTSSLSLLADNLDVVMAAMSGLFAIKIAGYFIAGAAAVNAYFAANAELAALVVAEKAALVARAEAVVLSTAATAASTAAKLVESEAVLAGLVARRAEIIAIRESVVAQLAQARTAIASAEAAIAAASAAGAQSYALRILTLSTAQLSVAETARVAAMAELASLGVAQARVSTQITAATAAQTAASVANTAATTAQAAAQAGLAGAAARTAVSANVLTTALRFLGGPVGIITGLLGIGVTAWILWGSKAKESADKAKVALDESTAEMIDRLDKQISKLKERNAIRDAVPAAKGANDAEADVIARAKRDMDDAMSGTGRFKGRSESGRSLAVKNLTAEYELALKRVADLQAEVKKAADGTRNQQLTKWYGENGTAAQRLAAELEKLKKQFGDIPPEMEKLVRAKFIDKNMVSTSKAQVEANLEAIKSGIEREKNMRAEGVTSVTELQRQGLASDYEVYIARRGAAIKAGEDSVKVFDAEIAALSAYNGKDVAERIANDAKIKQLGTQRNEVLRSSLVAAEQLRVAYEYDRDKPARDAEAANAKELVAINDQIDATERQVAAFNKLPSAVTAATIAQLEAEKATVSLFEGSDKAVAAIDAKIAAYTRLAGMQKVGEVLDTSTSVAKAKELLDILVAVDNAAKSAAEGMAASFGTVGTAIGGLTTALTDYAVQQQAVAAQLAAVKADPKSSTDKIARAEIAASKASAQAQIKSYGDMAAASKGFFKENSKGYKLLETTEKAFRAYEMTMAVESMVKKIFFKEGEVAANVALNATKLTGEAATTAASTGLAATEASAWGITAVVKAMASLPFPLNLAAGAATLAAVVAVGAKMFGGVGGGASVSQQRQAANGTGSVLGDSNAKSDSIAHSLAIMEKNSGLGLAHTISMDLSLKQMVAGIGNLAGLLARSGVVAAGGGAAAGIQTGTTIPGGSLGTAAGMAAGGLGGAALGAYVGMGSFMSTSLLAVGGPLGLAIGAVLGTVLGKQLGKLFGSTTSITDQGITGKAMSLGQIDDLGFTAQAYADVQKKKKAFGVTYSNKSDTNYANLSDEMNDQFTMIITGMGDTIRGAAGVLGLDGAAFNEQLNSFVVDLGKISLKDLTGEEQQKALETAFSKLGDDMARWSVAGIAQFQQVGEGYLETLVRVANEQMQVNDVLAVLGKSFNSTGLGAVKLSQDLIAAGGGLEKLTSGTAYFAQNFLSEAERMAPITKSVSAAMTALGYSSVTTNEQFKALVLAQDLNTAAGQALYGQLIAIAEPFKQAADYAAELAAATGEFAAVAKTASEIASEHRDLQQQLNELTKSDAELLAIQRAGIADVNKALFDQVQAAKAVVSAKDALATAYDKEATAAKTAIEKSKAWVTTLNGLNASMAQGTLSTLTPEQKYAEALAQFEKTLAAANSGDTTAQAGLSAAEQAFLTASQVVNASDAKYAADYARVVAANEEAAKWASQQVDVQQASLDALTAQVAGLVSLKDSVDAGTLTVAQAIAELQVAMGVTNGLGVKFTEAPAVPAVVASAAPAVDYSRYSAASNAGSDALAAEVKALREEVKGLRADQAAQTSAVVRATTESNAKAAGTVVAGVEKSAKASAWSSTVKGEYA
jgi:tape measure domain-containing protein